MSFSYLFICWFLIIFINCEIEKGRSKQSKQAKRNRSNNIFASLAKLLSLDTDANLVEHSFRTRFHFYTLENFWAKLCLMLFTWIPRILIIAMCLGYVIVKLSVLSSSAAN